MQPEEVATEPKNISAIRSGVIRFMTLIVANRRVKRCERIGLHWSQVRGIVTKRIFVTDARDGALVG